jgi:hypothetical protein
MKLEDKTERDVWIAALCAAISAVGISTCTKAVEWADQAVEEYRLRVPVPPMD